MEEKNTPIKLKFPVKIYSEANIREHWTKGYKRKKEQRWAIQSYLKISLKEPPSLPVTVHLTRIAPRLLDSQDNLRSAFKGVIDTIADYLIPGLAPGRADGDERIQWTFQQKKGKPKEYGLEIEFED